jgi:hypothetical protein
MDITARTISAHRGALLRERTARAEPPSAKDRFLAVLSHGNGPDALQSMLGWTTQMLTTGSTEKRSREGAQPSSLAIRAGRRSSSKDLLDIADRGGT